MSTTGVNAQQLSVDGTDLYRIAIDGTLFANLQKSNVTTVSAVADDFAEKNFKGKVVIGVHIRYYDKSLPKITVRKSGSNRKRA